MTPERLDHMTVQYIWALESNQAFVARARHEVERGHFSQFRRIVGTSIMPIRKLVGEEDRFSLSGVEWSYLYLELWSRLGGSCSPYGFSSESNMSEFRYQLDRLNEADYTYTTSGVQKSALKPVGTNPCAEIALGESQPCILQPQEEQTMSIIKITHVTYINSTPVENIKDDELIEIIKKAEENVAELKKVKAKSEKIKTKIAELEAGIGEVVAILDARV